MESNCGCKIYDLEALAFFMSLMSAVLMLIDFFNALNVYVGQPGKINPLQAFHIVLLF